MLTIHDDLTVEFGLEIYTSVTEVLLENISSPPFGLAWSGCVLDSAPYIVVMPLVWSVNMLVSFTFFALMMYKFLQMTRVDCSHEASVSTRNRSLLFQFVQDGTLFFLIIFFVILTVALFVNIQSWKDKSGILSPLLPPVYSICGSRLILNLRSAADPDNMTLITIAESQVSSLRVADQALVRRGTEIELSEMGYDRHEFAD